MASDGWRGSDAVYRNGLRGLAVSAVCKVARSGLIQYGSLVSDGIASCGGGASIYGM